MSATAAIRDPELKRLRAVKMLECRLKNMSIAAIAKEFNVHRDTVERTLDWAKRAGLVTEYEDAVLQNIIPLALSAYAEMLSDDEVDPKVKAQLVIEALKGVGLLKKPTDKPSTPSGAANSETLEGYIRKIRGGPSDSQPSRLARLVAQGTLPAAPAGGSDPGPVLEGESVVVAEGTASAGKSGDEDRAAGE